MKKISIVLAISILSLALAGCTTPGTKPRSDPNAAVVERVDPVLNLGTGKAVLSLHKRKAFPDACTYGITLTNNLQDEIVNIAFRFSAYIDGSTFHSYQTKSFFGIKPSEHKYTEMTFQQIRCDQIDRLEVTDPGRCAIGKTVTRFTTGPGDCVRYVDIAPTQYVNLTRK
jgi:uncharacterized protein YcfL